MPKVKVCLGLRQRRSGEIDPCVLNTGILIRIFLLSKRELHGDWGSLAMYEK